MLAFEILPFSVPRPKKRGEEQPQVTIDKSLKSSGRLVRSRNVLTRAERIAQLQLEDRWSEDQSPLGLPKVRVQKTVVGRKKKKKKKEEDEEAGGDAEAASTD